jgi:hypothetical protein
MAVKIQFAQGMNVGNIGEALVGLTGSDVVASDGNASPGSISHYRWTWIDVPTLSAFPLGFITEGPVSSISFNPDVEGDYHLMVEAFGTTGFKTVDRRVFRVELASTRALPAFDAEADALNFGGQTRGWKPDMEKWLLYLEALVSPGMSSVGAQNNIQKAGAVAGTFDASGLYSPAPGAIAPAAAGIPTTGFIRTPAYASTILWHGKVGGNDAPILWQQGATLQFGDRDQWDLAIEGKSMTLWAKVTQGILYGGASALQALTWNANGVQIGGAPSLGGGTYVMGLRAASVVPGSNPSGGIVCYSEASDDYALKYRKPSGAIVKLDTFAEAYDPSTNGTRLTVVSNTPIPLSDTSNATVIFLTAYKSATIALRTTGTGARWIMRTYTTQPNIALSGLSSNVNYDVFAYWTGTDVALELSAAWASNVARTDAIVRLNGVWVKNADVTRRYVGTFRTTSATQTQDTRLQRFVWNVDNQVENHAWVEDLTSSWAVNLAAGTWRQVRSVAANRVEVVIGIPTPMSGYAQMLQSGLPAGTGVAAWTGFGIDSTTVNIGFAMAHLNSNNAILTQWNVGYSICDTVLDIGYHAINWLESGHTSSGGVTAYGTTGQSRTHMRVRLPM